MSVLPLRLPVVRPALRRPSRKLETAVKVAVILGLLGYLAAGAAAALVTAMSRAARALLGDARSLVNLRGRTASPRRGTAS